MDVILLVVEADHRSVVDAVLLRRSSGVEG